MKNFGKAWIILVSILIVVLLVGLGIFRWYISGYNKAVNLEQGAEKAWADIDAALQRRLDLVPNLVNTVKGYAEHEKELFENIAKSREKYFQAGTRAGKIEASNQLTGFLSRLLMLQERYPDLKASDNFRDLQVALEGTENRIAVARTRYNEASKLLNSYSRCRRGRVFRGHQTGKNRSAKSGILSAPVRLRE
jgi:LemA protein